MQVDPLFFSSTARSPIILYYVPLCVFFVITKVGDRHFPLRFSKFDPLLAQPLPPSSSVLLPFLRAVPSLNQVGTTPLCSQVLAFYRDFSFASSFLICLSPSFFGFSSSGGQLHEHSSSFLSITLPSVWDLPSFPTDETSPIWSPSSPLGFYCQEFLLLHRLISFGFNSLPLRFSARIRHLERPHVPPPLLGHFFPKWLIPSLDSYMFINLPQKRINYELDSISGSPFFFSPFIRSPSLALFRPGFFPLFASIFFFPWWPRYW